jgi:hypothetical protein
MSLEILISCFIPSIYRLVEAGFFAGDVQSKAHQGIKALPPDTQQNCAGKAASITILRFQQELTIMIMLKPWFSLRETVAYVIRWK